jgi:SAM-dependent methyltransferase
VHREQFDHTYTTYWNAVISQAIAQGVPSGDQAAATLEVLLGASSLTFENALDVGCGSGRMQEILAGFAETTWGVEPEETAATVARSTGYQTVWHAPAESVPTDSDFFDLIFCWAVFEILDQRAALLEFNRILRPGGVAVITGKNIHYFEDDMEADAAERGALSKGFAQSFTDVRALRDELTNFGFEFISGIAFARRGDFAQFKHASLESLAPKERFYEFAVAVRKRSLPTTDPGTGRDWSSPCSLNLSEQLGSDLGDHSD